MLCVCVAQTVGSGWDAKVSSNTFRDFPYDYSTLVENLLDVGHVCTPALDESSVPSFADKPSRGLGKYIWILKLSFSFLNLWLTSHRRCARTAHLNTLHVSCAAIMLQSK